MVVIVQLQINARVQILSLAQTVLEVSVHRMQGSFVYHKYCLQIRSFLHAICMSKINAETGFVSHDFLSNVTYTACMQFSKLCLNDIIAVPFFTIILLSSCF